jgi:methionine-rich copper-binding protein CopC
MISSSLDAGKSTLSLIKIMFATAVIWLSEKFETQVTNDISWAHQHLVTLKPAEHSTIQAPNSLRQHAEGIPSSHHHVM